MQDPIKIQNDFKPYIDQFHLVQPEKSSTPNTPAPTSGNGLLYTAQAIVALYQNQALTQDLIINFRKAYKDCQIFPGLFKRAPNKTDLEGPDDYYGVALASMYLSKYSVMAKNVLTYGQTFLAKYNNPEFEPDEAIKILNFKISRKTLNAILFPILKLFYPKGVPYVYNNQCFQMFHLSAWMGRFPQLIAHFKFATHKNPTFFEKIFWCLSLIKKPSKNHHDAWILSWCKAKVYQNTKAKNFLCNIAYKIFAKRLKNTWGNIGECLGDYFKNPNHPNSLYLKNDKL